MGHIHGEIVVWEEGVVGQGWTEFWTWLSIQSQASGLHDHGRVVRGTAAAAAAAAIVDTARVLGIGLEARRRENSRCRCRWSRHLLN